MQHRAWLGWVLVAGGLTWTGCLPPDESGATEGDLESETPPAREVDAGFPPRGEEVDAGRGYMEDPPCEHDPRFEECARLVREACAVRGHDPMRCERHVWEVCGDEPPPPPSYIDEMCAQGIRERCRIEGTDPMSCEVVVIENCTTGEPPPPPPSYIDEMCAQVVRERCRIEGTDPMSCEVVVIENCTIRSDRRG